MIAPTKVTIDDKWKICEKNLKRGGYTTEECLRLSRVVFHIGAEAALTLIGEHSRRPVAVWDEIQGVLEEEGLP